MTTFFRLLKDSDKASALESALHDYTAGSPDEERTFRVDPEKFRKVPNSPFAYWVDDSIRDLFQKLPPFESEGRTVKQGLATADDFRFVRAWWEVDADRRLDPGLGGAPDWRTDLPGFQAWCRKRTHQGKYWVPFAKGGEYSPYYSDIHLVVNWKNEGEEIKNFADPKTGKTYSRPQNTDYYFRPGVTWPVRTAGFSVRALPAGSIFGHKGSCVFSNSQDELDTLLAYLNTSIIQEFLFIIGVGREEIQSYEVGVLKMIPMGINRVDVELIKLIEDVSMKIKQLQQSHINSTANNGDDAVTIIKTIENYIKAEMKAIESEVTNRLSQKLNDQNLKSRLCEISIERPQLSASIKRWVEEASSKDTQFMRIVNGAFGSWDVRILNKDAVIQQQLSRFDSISGTPPISLLNPSGLPATSGNIVSEAWLRSRPDAVSLPPPGSVARPPIPDSEYPIPIPWDGVLAEDPDSPDDLLARIRLVLKILHGERAEEVERELAEGLGVRDLRDYVADPMGFFEAHLKTYSKSRRKAPIYWPLSTTSGGYTVWVYYPRLTDATLYAVHELARKKAEVLDLERAELAARKDRSRAEQQRFDRVSRDAAEVRDFAQEVLRIAGLSYKPDHDDGVPICAAPLYGLFRHSGWSKYLKAIWEELQEGKYDWSHLAYALWPERVRDKARRDKSLAIAHGLEDLK